MSRKFSRRNYHEALDKLVPQIYTDEDIKLASEKDDLPSKILDADADLVLKFLDINGLLYQFGTVAGFSSLGLSGWNSVDFTSRTASATDATYKGYNTAIVKYFIPQNNLTTIKPVDFQLEIMTPLGYDINDYATSASFNTFLSSTLLPSLQLGDGKANGPANRNTSLPTAFGATYLEQASYLINALGLFSLINYDQYYTTKIRKLIAEKFTDKFFIKKETVTLADALEILKRLSFVYTDLQPRAWSDEFRVSSTSYLSGTQSLDKYLTWNSILYDLPSTEEDDTFTKDFYIKFFDEKSFVMPRVTEGPLKKFLTAMGFLMGDLDNQSLSIESLNSINECPDEYLPYLADQIGWRFYTSNTDSWRRQLRDSRKLFQKKGTKQGLIDLLKSILPATEINFDKSYQEYYESYVPYLIYYMLKTESAELASFDSWNQIKANAFAGGEFDPTNMDTNIRFVVDHMLEDAYYEFSDLFNIQGVAFNPDHPKFTFNYRGRDFNMPPFEDERFYKDCDLTFDLVEFFKEKLLCLGVKATLCDSFERYILDNTVEGDQDAKLYNNGFFFLTKNLNQAPNYDRIITDLESKLYDYLPLWNGKSSNFTLEVSSGYFDDKFFVQTAYTTEDFFESLKAIEDFVPAKAIPRIDVSLRHADITDSHTNTAPRASVPFVDTPNPSGAMASFEVSTLNMRDKRLGLTGSSIDPNYVKDPRSTNDYSSLPVFKRDRLTFSRNTALDAVIDVSSVYTVSGPYERVAPRTATRRRDLQKNLSKGQVFRRDGFNPPSFLNVNTKGSAASLTALGTLSSMMEYVPLGLIPSSNSFTPVYDHLNIPSVYDECEDTTSNNVFNGVRSKYTFKTRGAVDSYNLPLDDGFINNLVYKYRDNLDDIYKLIVDMKDEDLEMQAKLTVDLNMHLARSINWKNEYESLKSSLWNNLDYSIENDFNKMRMDFYKRLPNEFNKTFHYLYLNDYIKQGRGSLANTTLDDALYGGGSLISHIYGPTFYNALHKLDGSAVGTVLASIDPNNKTVFDRKTEVINNKIKSITQDIEFEMRHCDNNLSATSFQVGVAPESFSPNYISGVEIHTFRNSNSNKMFVYDLSSDEGFLSEQSTLLDGNLLGLKAKEFLPRLKYTLNYKEPDTDDNFLRPEHNFSVELSSLFLREDSFDTDERTASIWIHTEKETDYYGNNIFWNYMPNGTWERIDVSSVEGGEGISYVRNNLVHNFTHGRKTIEDKAEVNSCYIDDVNREVLYSLYNEDFNVDRVNFNTLNRHIAVPLSYYQYEQQVHRSGQKYVIEVFPSLSQDDKQFWVTKGIKCIDQTMRARASVEKSFTIPDYSLSLTDTTRQIEFFYPDGSPVQLGTSAYVTIDGEVYVNDQQLTISVAKGSKRILYDQAFIGTLEYPNTPFSTSGYFERPYEGYVNIQGYTPAECLVVLGKIKNPETLFIRERNVINDPTVSALNAVASNVRSAVQVKKAAKIPSGETTTGCQYFSGTDTNQQIGKTEFKATQVNTATFFNSSYVQLSATNIDSDYPSTMGASYIKNDVGAEYLFNTNQIAINPEASSNYLSNEATCQYFTPTNPPSSITTSGHADTITQYADEDLYDFFIDSSKKERFENLYDYDYQNNLVFYEPTSIGSKNNYVVFTLVFAEGDNPPDKITLDLGAGGFSPHHQYQRVCGVEYHASGNNSGKYNFRAPLNDFYLDGDWDLGMRNFPAFKSSKQLREIDTNAPINLEGDFYYTAPFAPPTVGSYGIYEIDSKWKLMYIAVDCAWMGTFATTEPQQTTHNQGDDMFVEFHKDMLNTPAKASIGLFQSDDPVLNKSAQIDIAHFGIHSDMLPVDYGFPLAYFLKTISTSVKPDIYGKNLGNTITKTVEQQFVRKPKNLLSIFRFYNDISEELQSRDKTKTEKFYGPDGGGRSNYRIHPAQFADTTLFHSSGRIDNLDITN